MSAPPIVRGTPAEPVAASSSLAGAGLIIIAAAFVAASTLCAKMLGTGDNPLNALQITWGRYFFALFALLAVAAVLRPEFTKPNWKLHSIRVTGGVFGVMLMFTAAGLIPLADVTAISFLNPMFAMVFAIPFLGERVGPIRWGMAALALCGATLLIRPGTQGFQPEALFALAAAVLFGMEVVALKMLTGREGAFQIILIANVLGTLIAFIGALFVWIVPTTEQWFWLAATGVLMVTAQGFYTNALRLADASFVLPFSYATLLFAAFYDFMLFDVVPLPLSLLGGLVIVVSGIVLAWRESLAARRKSKALAST